MPDFKTTLKKLNDAGWPITKHEMKAAMFGEDKQIGLWKFYAVLVKQLLKHRLPQPYITEDSGVKFTWLKKAYESAQDFKTGSGVEPENAYEEYVKCGLKVMLPKYYSLSRFSSWDERIWQYHKDKAYINEIPQKRRKAFYLLYESMVFDMAGYQTPQNKMNQKYALDCSEAMRMAEECKATDADWVEAQFEGFRAVGAGHPSTAKLHDANAPSRYSRYINQ